VTIRPRLPKGASVLLLAGSLLLAGALALSGCSSQSNTSANAYPAATAQALQSQVLAVSQSTAGGDFAGSLTRLDELDLSVKDALARGTIGKDRYSSISAAIALVRSDLASAVAAELQRQQQLQTPTPTPKPGKDGQGDSHGNGKND
jgi:outer membrane lipoprotein SlyB